MTLIPIENTTEKQRARAYWTLLETVILHLHPTKDDTYRTNLQRFLLHVAWHEGATLTAREQWGRTPGRPGPARSFMQLEAMRAKEAVEYGLTKPDFKKALEKYSGKTAAELKQSASELGARASYYPDGNTIEELLRTIDEFGILLARIAFWKIPGAIGTSNKDHAWYWYEHWKRTGGDRSALEKTFKEKADVVDQYLP